MDIQLDNTGDLLISHFGISTTTDAVSALVQRLKIKLQLFKGEWFLNTNAGVPYFQEIFVKGFDQAYVDTIFRSIIINTTDVKSLQKYSSSFDRTNRKFSFTFTVLVDSTGTSETITITI